MTNTVIPLNRKTSQAPRQNVSSSQSEAQVVDFASFRARKEIRSDRTQSLNDVYTSSSQEREEDFASRIERIKSSINRIHNLMKELRTMSDSPEKPKA